MAATYYVDFTSGSDANNGTSTGTPFKTIPGTRTVNGSSYLNSSWGSFTSSSKIPENTTFIVKAGGDETSAIAGYVLIAGGSGDFYTYGCSNVVIEVTNTWGTGTTATIDCAGMTVPIAGVLIQIDGVTVAGITVANSALCGFQLKEKPSASQPETNTVFNSCTTSNCGTSLSTDAGGSGIACLQVRNAVNLTVNNCTIIGNANWICGMILGDSNMYVENGLVENCNIYGLIGSPPLPESGLGIRCLNGQLTISNCVSHDNMKGFDLGEDNANTVPIVYTVQNSVLSNNLYGCNFSNVGTTENTFGPATFYIFNCIIISNQITGSKVYAGPYNFYAVNNDYIGNGWNSAAYSVAIYNAVNMAVGDDQGNDTNLVNFYGYNNIMASPFGYQYMSFSSTPTNHVNWFLDYNSYQQRSAESFAIWSLSYGPDQASFTYGVNGAGHASGNWYSWYGSGAVNLSGGIGHFNCDPHSTGTGAANTGLPSLNPNYTLKSSFQGINLTSQSWYVPAMGFDLAGNKRMNWDVGAFEYPPNLTIGTATFQNVNP
jgi:Right handed beta helix region